MKLIRQLEDLPREFRGGAVSIGNFDGVHRGHARIVERLKRMAEEVGGPAVVFTFDPHPVRVLRPQHAPPPLTWTDRKATLLAQLGVNAMLVYPTDEQLLSLTPTAFFQHVVIDSLDARAVVEGPNFFFGQARAGTVEVLAQLCSNSARQLEVVQPLMHGDDYISSSRVRELVRQGDVSTARNLLTEPYRIRGMVTHGAARGAKIGFPTANIDAVDTLLPAQGVYAGRAIVAGSVWPAAINVGPNPTFGEHALKVEAHLIEFGDSLYGKPLEVDFLARLRDIRSFDSVERLKEQLAADVQKTRTLCATK